jgi:G:T/U-mismatch repair DNA glycosylase
MITRHQYLDRYPIAAESKLLILGTIHPHNTTDFQIPFFYGNRNSIWNLLSDAFPDELHKPISLDGVLSFLQSRKIAISDTISQCRRLNPTALDQDLIPEALNHDLLQQIRQSKIERILCTSAFGKNNAFKLFYEDILRQKISFGRRYRHSCGQPGK